MGEMKWTASELAALGLSEGRAAQEGRLEVSLEATHQGFSGAVSVEALMEAPVGFVPLAQEVVEAVGARLECHQRQSTLMRLVWGQALEVRPGGASGLWGRSEEGCAYLDVERLPALAAVVGADGRALCLRREGEGVTIMAFLSEVAFVDDLQEIEAPLLAWAEGCGDVWLGSRLREAASGAAWERAVGVGLALRHWPLAPRSPAGLRLWLSGKGPAPAVGGYPAQGWGAAQSASLLEALEARAVAEARRLGEALGAVEEEMAVCDQGWQARFARALVAREELEGVLGVLQEGMAGDALGESLRRLDEVYEELPGAVEVFALGEASAPLKRALEADPGCWWGEASLWA